MGPKVVVNGKEYPFITEADLTLGEAAEVERITGQGYDLADIGAAGALALIYVSVKRVDASATVDDIKALKGDEFDFIIDEGDAVPPLSSEGSDVSEKPSPDPSATGSDVAPVEPPEPIGAPV